MYYVYDMPMNKRQVKSFQRYGVRYKLERKFLMGDRVYYSFTAPGCEKIMVVPGFAEQYEEVKDMLKKLTGKQTYADVKKWARRAVGRIVEEEDYPTEESANGVMKVMTLEYKDIHVGIEYLNDAPRISDDFEIVQNNIFGNGVVVTMNMNMED